jgi:1-acyl-sn-glycerol-3-phosphate acyltransferase
MDSPRRLPLGHVLQRELGRLLAPLWIPLAVALLRFGMGYRIEDKRAIREKFRRIRCDFGRPLLVCANHLTLIDSFLVAWALSPPWRYALRYDELPWNVPERVNFASNLRERAGSYVMKCIPITRGGSRVEVAAVLDRVATLVRGGETALLFPEAGRSRTGRVEVDRAAWGVGRVVGAVPGCRVVCVYLRARGQQAFSDVPPRGSLLDVEVECIQPKSDSRGVRRSRDFARQIVSQLARMEREYFDGRE